MKQVFADTSFYIALVNPADENHDQAIRLSQEWRRSVTSEFVLLEVGNALSKVRSRGKFVAFLKALRANPNARIVPVSKELLDAGFEFYSQRMDKDWSLTDCISFIIMDRRGLRDALTADHHFEQAGFNALIR